MKFKQLSLRNTILGGFVVAATLLNAVEAKAQDFKASATLTADNFYGLFYGNEDGSTLNFVGRNETGDSGSSGRFNWSVAESWDFGLNYDDHMYVVAWDDGRVAESWIGEIKVDDRTILTGMDDWEYIIGGDNPYLENRANNLLPDGSELQSFIGDADWQDTISIGKNGIRPWNTIANIDQEADWLKTASHSQGKYTIFRTKNTLAEVAGIAPQSVPEPASGLALLAVAAGGALKVRKRKS